MSVLDLAARRAHASAVTTYSALDAFPQFVETDGGQTFTRALAVRDSDDAVYAVYARGAHEESIVDALNTRARLSHERAMFARDLEALPEASDDESEALSVKRETLTALVAERVAALDALVRVKADPTYHVSRTLMHYSATDGGDD